MRDLAAALRSFGGSGVLKTRRLGYDGKGQRLFRSRRDRRGRRLRGDGRRAAHPRSAGCLRARDLGDRGPRRATAGSPPTIRPRMSIATAFCTRRPCRRGFRRRRPRRHATPPSPSSRRSIMSASSASSSSCSRTGRCWSTRSRRASTIPAIGPRPPVPSRSSSSIFAPFAGLPLGSPTRHSDCVMENLIGDEVLRVPALLAEPDLVLHLYGKTETRPGRKMGHFTRLRASWRTSQFVPIRGSTSRHRPPRL